MTEYDNANTGVLFRNEKRPGKRDPDYRGSAEPVCAHCRKTTPMWVDSWINEKSSGEKYMRLKYKPKEARTTPTPEPEPVPESFNDDIPF